MSKGDIQITPKPFVILFTILLFCIGIGSIWNVYRIREKVDIVRDHAKTIYTANQKEFVDIAKFSSGEDAARSTLRTINEPERGNYYVHVISYAGSEQKILEGGMYFKKAYVPTDVQEEILNDLEKNDEIFATTETFFGESNREGNILAFVPITENGTVLGFVLVEVDRTKDL